MKKRLALIALAILACNSTEKEDTDPNPCTLTKASTGKQSWGCPASRAPNCFHECEFYFEFADGRKVRINDSFMDTLQYDVCDQSKYAKYNEGYVWPSCETLRSDP